MTVESRAHLATRDFVIARVRGATGWLTMAIGGALILQPHAAELPVVEGLDQEPESNSGGADGRDDARGVLDAAATASHGANLFEDE